ncbi:MAG: holo-ACP synthase [Clostridiales Family XIII bacterium]|jgi:holo-[acyl-carrier protein] synthase|nr:holo-ACP synthase [Clostridiales Family XIII bacterium]
MRMEIIGVGTDIVAFDRMEKGARDPAFLAAVYTEAERREAASRPVPLHYYATRFAAKEAVYKCIGGDAPEIRLSDIEILSLPSGKPAVALHGRCRELAAGLGIHRIHLSLSYEAGAAVAFAVAESL